MCYVVQYYDELHGPFATTELARYWIAAQRAWDPVECVILPLYPVT